MHMTGKEKTLAAKAVHQVPLVGGAASDVAFTVWGKVSLSTGLFFDRITGASTRLIELLSPF
jgi:hypothetical protein